MAQIGQMLEETENDETNREDDEQEDIEEIRQSFLGQLGSPVNEHSGESVPLAVEA